MKKIMAVLLMVLLLGSYVGVAQAEALSVRIGWVVCLEEELSEEERYAAENHEETSLEVPDEYTYTITEYETINELLMAFQYGRINVLNASLDTINYIIRRNPEYEENLVLIEPYDVNFVMALLPDKEAMRDQLDSALRAMIEDGTRDALVEKWILNFDPSVDPVAVEMPVFEGAPTIRVGITGDILPMDYTTATGTPAGFNTDVLRYISEYLQINIEMIPVAAGARMIAMSTDRVDCIFWFMDFILDESDTLITTIPYHSSPLANLCSNELAEAIMSLYPQDQIITDAGSLESESSK